jgi:hypothetical protein
MNGTSADDRSAAGRLAYLDWLRFMVVLLLAPFHGALSYTGFGTVYVYDKPVRDAVLAGYGLYGHFGPEELRLFTVFVDNWSMHLLFFVSGMGATLSLQKRSAAGFMDERSRRLMLPFVIILLAVIPIQSWFRALNFYTFSGGFFAFYPHFFNGISAGPGSPGNFDWGHLWFLLYLFVFSLVALPLFMRWQRRGTSTSRSTQMPHIGSAAWILAPGLWIALLEAVFRPGWPGYQNLINDWANFTVYLSFFVFGFLVGTDSRLAEAIERNRFAALALGLIAFAARLACYRLLPVGSGYQVFNMLAQFLRGLAAWGLVLAAIGFGRRYFVAMGRPLGIARDLSFPLYLLHYAPLTAATYFLLDSDLGIWTRWALSVLFSWATVALCTFVFRYIPPLRSLFRIGMPGVAPDLRAHRLHPPGGIG